MVENGKVGIHFEHINHLVYRLWDMNFVGKNSVVLVCLYLANPIIVNQLWQQHGAGCLEFVDSFL